MSTTVLEPKAKAKTKGGRRADFEPGLWTKEINVRNFIQHNYEPYYGDEFFLAGPTKRTTAIWKKLTDLFVEERKKGVLDVSQIPSSITAHDAGYIDKKNEVIVGLQTDAPLKRAIMPNGGLKMVTELALRRSATSPIRSCRRNLHQISQDSQRRRVRRLHRGRAPMPQLPYPDRPSGRLWPRADHRRLSAGCALRRRQADRASRRRKRPALDDKWSTDEIIRDREELGEQIRALGELKEMAAKYGFDISGPAKTAKEAVQWLYFGYLASVKEQNGAAMSLGRVSTFLDIYFEQDLAAGILTEEQAQEIIDDFVIKLRIVRFLRTPEYDDLFAGDPTWVTESIAGMGDDGRPLATKTSFRFLQTLYNLGPGPRAEPDHLVHATSAGGVPPLRFKSRDRHQLDPVRKRRDHAHGMGRRWRDRLLRLADGDGQADAILRRAREPRQDTALRDQRRPRRSQRQAGRAADRAGAGRLSRLRRCRSIGSTR